MNLVDKKVVEDKDVVAAVVALGSVVDVVVGLVEQQDEKEGLEDHDYQVLNK